MTNLEMNLRGQLDYMCEEIAKALGLPKQSPAETVQSVRELMEMAERLKSSAIEALERFGG